MAIFEKTEKKYIQETYEIQKNQMYLNEIDNKTLFDEILEKIKSQSYDYSRIKNKKLYTSLFFDVENPSDIFIPLYNYFDNTVNWIRTNIHSPIQLTQKFKFYGAHKNILDSDKIYELFTNDKIKNLVLEPDKKYKYNEALNIQIAVEVLYKNESIF